MNNSMIYKVAGSSVRFIPKYSNVLITHCKEKKDFNRAFRPEDKTIFRTSNFSILILNAKNKE